MGSFLLQPISLTTVVNLTVVDCCLGNNLSWYPVSSNLTSYIREHWRLFRDSL